MTEGRQSTGMFGVDPMAAFAYWASFWPVAPFFGVEWRLAPWLTPVDQFMRFTAPYAEPAAGADAVGVPAEAAPVEKPAPAEFAAEPDDLTRIRGIGAKTARELNDLGVRSFAQLAALDAADLDRIDASLTGVKGACFRGDWVGQAKSFLA